MNNVQSIHLSLHKLCNPDPDLSVFLSVIGGREDIRPLVRKFPMEKQQRCLSNGFVLCFKVQIRDFLQMVDW